MILKYPLAKDMPDWHKRIYPEILHDITTKSGYNLIGIAESDFDIYVAFTNQKQDQVWIEKTHKLLGLSGMFFKSFVEIENNEEFDRAYKFFIKNGILDGTPDYREDTGLPTGNL